MFNLKLAIPEVRKKIELYFNAVDLFRKGKSFPQVVQILGETENNKDLITYVVEKAQSDDWEKIYKESKQMLDRSIPLMDIKKILKERDGDNEVVDFICEQWFRMKLIESDLRGASGNGIERGFQAVIYGVVFFIPLYSITSKWYILLIPGLFVFIGVLLILMSLWAKFIKIVIHKINNEPAKKFISKKN